MLGSGVFELGVGISVFDRGLSMIDQAEERWKSLGREIIKTDEGLTMFENHWNTFKTGGVIAALGVSMLALTGSMVSMRSESGALESNLRSLKVAQEDIVTVSQGATLIAARWGQAKNATLDGAYQIKSAISQLDGSDLAEFAGIVTQTGVATKGEFTQMADLFGQTFHQFRDHYANLNDLDFGRLIGNTIASGVQKYRTDGAAMAQAMTSLGSTAAALSISLTEQTAVLGTLQNQMNPGEAGTAYRAFLARAGEGMHKLGLNATDAQGRLRSMPQLLTELRGKFGEQIDVTSELPALYKAFGEEGAKVVLNLLPHIEALGSDIEEMGAAAANLDFSNLEEMSAARINTLPGTLARISEGFKALWSDMGGGPADALNAVLQPVAMLVEWLAKLAAEHPGIARFAGTLFAIAGAAVFMTGVVMMAGAAWNMYKILQYQAAIAQGVNAAAASKLGIVHTLLAAKTWLANTAAAVFSATLWANPITWVIAGVIGLIALIAAIIIYWDEWTAAVRDGFNYLRENFLLFEHIYQAGVAILWVGEQFIAFVGWVVGGVQTVGGYLQQFYSWVQRIIALGFSLSESFGEWYTNLPAGVKMALFVLSPLAALLASIIANAGLIRDTIGDLMAGNVSGAFEKILQIAKRSGAGFLLAFLDGVKSAAGSLLSGIKFVFDQVGAYLPHSDAKVGPLSTLTKSGHSLVTTFAGGMMAANNELPTAMNSLTSNLEVAQLEAPDAAPLRLKEISVGDASLNLNLSVANLIGQIVQAAPDETFELTAADLKRLLMKALETQPEEGVA